MNASSLKAIALILFAAIVCATLFWFTKWIIFALAAVWFCVLLLLSPLLYQSKQ